MCYWTTVCIYRICYPNLNVVCICYRTPAHYTKSFRFWVIGCSRMLLQGGWSEAWTAAFAGWHWSRKDRYHVMFHWMKQIRPRKLETCKWDKTSNTTFKQQKKVDIINHQSSPFQEFLGPFSSINRAPWAPLSRDADANDANFCRSSS